MTESRAVLLIWLLVAVPLASCSKPNQPATDVIVSGPDNRQSKRIASSDVVLASVEPTRIKAGSPGELLVRLTIQSGYHVNANPATYPYLIATKLDLEPASEVSVGKISYPAPINAKLSFADKPIAVYEGEASIKVAVDVNKSAARGQRSLLSKLTIQACDDQVCYPPETVKLAIPVIIE